MSSIYRALIQRKIKVEGPLMIKITSPSSLVKGEKISFTLVDPATGDDIGEEETGVVWVAPDQDRLLTIVPDKGQF